ncbi:MAG: nitrogenase MoFe cofactor biosynthesis protein NifE [Dehalococcoides mccartyi]|uniref:nitrogenase iron-molybdenum cofactor biosynthesis protein NifE n=1 Tax=Dehalococcoides mccartyi TaxID=61435 RepID=UPI00242F1610|nr:nitrogenase iron-molybdenum cofactor biosynthesis protein NifE [Dehalococcoides mccartyi]MCF7635899.1 nitrogenase MoFe cofactor biosynthesis protein NifE [Dehalococcoides mccartyi]MEA2121242.1 Nitrogenase molybdenum-iron protein alpha chain [Dehalococcoides mccartyi]MEA2122041.1 Nitrogenase molybdenum-iron protein alpha chain [Dehalococcoides mccartyi]
MIEILKDRKQQVREGGKAAGFDMVCDTASLAGSVSQRACVFCGSRVVLYPIADALHLVHGPVGCAAYTWDIRGALSSGPQLHRMSFSTDLREKDVIFGGEKKLYRVLTELIDTYHPKAAFVYSTCIVGVIGDDVEAVCRTVSREKGIDVIPVHSEGFRGTKKNGYQAACQALSRLVGTAATAGISKLSLNILGDFNIAGEIWQIKEYYRRMGIQVVSTITGDARVDEIRRAHGASLNVVQCSGSMMALARMMQEKYGIPYLRVSYFGIEDMSKALYEVAEKLGDEAMLSRTRELVSQEVASIMPELREYRRKLEGARALVYTGGAFKVFSMVRSLRTLGIKTVVAGSQTGDKDDYRQLADLCDEDTVLLDDTNPLELAKYVQEKGVDLIIGGVKERPIAYKLGVGFCDHNHERKICLAGYSGMLNFAREVYTSVCSPVWSLMPRRRLHTGGEQT